MKQSEEGKKLKKEQHQERKNSKEEILTSSLQPLHRNQGLAAEKSANTSIAASLPKFDDESSLFQADGSKNQKANLPVIIDHDDQQDSIKTLFARSSNSPIIQTIRYSSRVSWKPKKAAWLIDYSQQYKTPLDFIYKSIQLFQSQPGTTHERAKEIAEGTEFNVFRNDVNFRFYLVVSFASTRLRLYYILPEEKKAVFLKSYSVCLGKRNTEKSSGSLTPFGLYQLGLRITTYEPHIIGSYKGKRVEMMQFFGTRWIPFEREVDPKICTEPAKGFGIHGMPYYRDANDKLVEDVSSCGKFESEGCIRLNRKDIEELYSLISLRQAYVEIVPDFTHSRLMKGQI
ncbi:MAG: L,D-transpeptidase [Chlamydia sp.]